MIKEINLEEGLPVVAQAMDRLQACIGRELKSGTKIIKIIHGYGSTGKGGKIRTAVRKELGVLKDKGVIVEYCTGERFEPFAQEARRILACDKDAYKDRDYARYNNGITLILLQER